MKSYKSLIIIISLLCFSAYANNENKITALELHNYVNENVVQQSSGSQTPELKGDKDRVLVEFN